MREFSLKHYQAFKKILTDYHMSERAKKALDGLDMVLIVAPTSGGKNTLIRHLLDTGKYYFIVSDTTRPPQLRDGKMEKNGVEYFFRSEPDVLKDLKKGEFLEATLIHEQQVSGISIRELEKAKEMNKVAVTDININGAESIKTQNPGVKAIFLVPPSFEEWQRRIEGKTEMSKSEVANRMRSADKELRHALDNDFYQYVVTEDINNSVKIIDDIVHYGKNIHQSKGKQLIVELHNELRRRFPA